MPTPIELQPPLAGLSENVARSDQEPGTTLEFDNARTVDPVSGRIRPAQRAGSAQFVAGAVKAVNTKVDLVASVGYALDLIDYTQLTDLTSPAIRDEKVYLSSSKAEAFSPQTDSSGNVYFLDQSDTILVLTADLVKLGQIILPLQSTDTVCRTIVVDDRNFVYAAASTPGSFNNGVVWRFSKKDGHGKDDPPRWVQDWEFPVPSSVVRLTYSSGMLAVGQRDRGGQKDRSSVTILNVISDAPVQAWTRSLPDPVRDVAFDRDNNLLVTSPYSPGRTLAADDAGFQDTAIDWTLWELTNQEERLWSWFDAELLEGVSWGDKVRKVTDARFDPFWSDLGNVPNYAIDDDTDRFIHRLEFESGEVWRPPPTYDSAAFGSKPGIAFDGTEGQILVGRPNNAGEARGAADAKSPKNKGVIPGMKGVAWAYCFVARVAPSPRPMHIFSVREGPLKFAVVANIPSASWDPTDANAVAASPGTVALWGPTGSFTAGAGTPASGVQTSAHNYMTDGGAAGNTVQSMLITIVHDGTGVNSGEFRVNGTQVELFDWTTSQQFSTQKNGARGMFGAPQILNGTLGVAVTKTVTKQVPNPETGVYETVSYEVVDETLGPQPGDVFGETFDVDALDGVIGEGFCILGDTTVTPNDTAIAALDIEKAESYLAYKWGIQHLLPVGHTYDQAAGMAVGTGEFTGADALATELQAAFMTDKPITAKLSGSAGALMWAFNGPGMGLAVAGNKDGDVFTYGPRETGTDQAAGALSPIALKVIDEGTRVERGTASTGVLTFTGNVVNNDQVQIGAITYTFRAAVATANQVLVGGSTAASITNLAAAINLTGTAGTEYGTGTEKHHQVDAVAAATTLTVSAVKRGSSEDSLTTTDPVDAGAVMSWGAGTLTGGDAKNTWTVTAQHSDSSVDPPDDPPSAYAHLAGAGSAFQIAVDDEGDCYHTRNNTTDTNAGVYKYDKAGDATGNATLGAPWKWILGYDNSPTIGKYTGIAFPPAHPDYGTQPITGPLFMYVTTEGPEGASAFDTPTVDSVANLHKVRLVDEARNSNDSVRGKKLIAVSGGDVKRFTKAGSYTTVTAGAGALLDPSPFIDGFVLYSRLFLFDGASRAKSYDPRRDAISTWIADKGETPERIILGAPWRGRACVVTADKPHNIVMARHGDPDDFDLFPEVPSYEQAISLDQVEAIGEFPDVVQCMYPIDSERLLVGGDSSTMLLVGDPATVALGDFGKSYFSLISDEVGIAFGGQSATKDPQGILYWFGSKGGVFAWSGQGQPERLSLHRVERRLADIDLAIWKPGLVWNYRRDELILAFFHRTTGGVLQDRFIWCKKTGAWTTDSSARATHQPSCMTVLDGDDPGDRHLAYGCEDGIIRMEDEARADDDGQRIYSKLTLGPYQIGGVGAEGILKALECALAEEQDGVDYEVFVSDQPTRPTNPAVMGRLGRGFTIQRVRARGGYLWIRLTNGAVTERWALEQLVARVAQGGRRRVRT